MALTTGQINSAETQSRLSEADANLVQARDSLRMGDLITAAFYAKQAAETIKDVFQELKHADTVD